jgi:hypothetical protein
VVAAALVAALLLCGGLGAVAIAWNAGVLGGKRSSAGSAQRTTAATANASAETSVTELAAKPPAAKPPAKGSKPPVAAPVRLPPVSTPDKNTPERQALMDAARTYFGTGSQFYVNQLYVQGGFAVGDIGAVQGGHRVWVVWKGSPWRVVYSGDWGVVDEQVLRAKVPGITQDLLGAIDWTKTWPADFTFQ